jgi:hypothetical protein
MKRSAAGGPAPWSRLGVPLVLACGLAACGGGGGVATTAGEGDPAAASMTLAAQPVAAQPCTLGRIVLAVQAVGAKQSGPWTQVTLRSPRLIDLLHVNGGVMQTLGLPPLTAGEWHDVRLVLVPGASNVQWSGRLPVPLNVPGGAVRLSGDFSVDAGTMADLVPQYEGTCAAVHSPGATGEYMLTGAVPTQPRLLPFASGQEAPVNAALHALLGGGYFTTYAASDGTLLVRRFDGYGNPVSYEAAISMAGTASTPVIAPLVDGSYVAMWLAPSFDPWLRFAADYPLMVRRFDATGAPLAPAVLVAITQPFSAAIMPPSLPQITALPDGGYALVWVQSNAGSLDVHLQRFTAAGLGVGTEQRVNSGGPGGLPNVTALPGGRILVSWGIGSVFARVYAADGTGGAEQSLAPLVGSVYGAPSTAALAGGGVLAWTRQMFGSAFIEAAVLAPDGALVVPPFIVDGSTFGNQGPAPQTQPSVAALADGGFVVAWVAFGNVYARRFDAAAAPVGAVERVNLVSHGASAPTVVPLAWGGFIVTWGGLAADATAHLYARMFDAQALTSG